MPGHTSTVPDGNTKSVPRREGCYKFDDHESGYCPCYWYTDLDELKLGTTSKSSSDAEVKQDTNNSIVSSVSKREITGKLPTALTVLGTIAEKKRKMQAAAMAVKAIASEKSPLKRTLEVVDLEDSVEEAESDSSQSSMQSDHADLSVKSQKMTNSQDSSSETPQESDGSSQSSNNHATSQVNGSAAGWLSTTATRELESLSGYAKSALVLELLSGLIPSVPEGLGTMATTMTLVRSSTTLQVKYHSGTCLTSSKATKCSCLSKAAMSPGDLQWSTLPRIAPGANGDSASQGTKNLGSSIAKKARNLSGASGSKRK